MSVLRVIDCPGVGVLPLLIFISIFIVDCGLFSFSGPFSFQPSFSIFEINGLTS